MRLILEHCKQHIEENLQECCQDVVDFKETGILSKNSICSQLASYLVKNSDSVLIYSQALTLIQNMINEQACQFVVDNWNSKERS